MTLNRYEHEEIKNKINGYMVLKRPGETHEQLFLRAKDELISNMKDRLEKVLAFKFVDYCKKDK